MEVRIDLFSQDLSSPDAPQSRHSTSKCRLIDGQIDWLIILVITKHTSHQRGRMFINKINVPTLEGLVVAISGIHVHRRENNLAGAKSIIASFMFHFLFIYIVSVFLPWTYCQGCFHQIVWLNMISPAEKHNRGMRRLDSHCIRICGMLIQSFCFSVSLCNTVVAIAIQDR